ncbi:MAG: GrpB family protein [Thermoleophilia bacterium]|nr:GrpB family protein [Thermoleophilia bacterium]
MVTIHPYQPDWPIIFQEIAATLRQALGRSALRIDHIGSTSVPGLAAKNRIDIQITVAELNNEILSNMLTLDLTRYKDLVHDHVPPGANKADHEWEKWLFVRRGGRCDANIHVRILGRLNQRYPLLFRDYLRCHPASADAYAELKRRLATSLADPDTYPDVKDPAVDLIYLAAEEWASATGWVMGETDV